MYNNFFEPLFEKTDVNIISNKILFDIGEYIGEQSDENFKNLQSTLTLLNYCLDIKPLAQELFNNQNLKTKLELAKVRIPQLDQIIKQILDKIQLNDQEEHSKFDMSIITKINDLKNEYLQQYLRIFRIYILYNDQLQQVLSLEDEATEIQLTDWLQQIITMLVYSNQENRDRILDIITYLIRQQLELIKLLFKLNILPTILSFLEQGQSIVRCLVLLRDMLEYNQLFLQQINNQEIIEQMKDLASKKQDQKSILILISQILNAVNYQTEQEQISFQVNEDSNSEDITQTIEQISLQAICDQLQYSSQLFDQLLFAMQNITLSEQTLLSLNYIFEKMIHELNQTQVKLLVNVIMNLLTQKLESQLYITQKVYLVYIHLLVEINQQFRSFIQIEQIQILKQYHSDDVKIMRQLDEISRFNNKVYKKFKDTSLIQQSGFMTSSIRQSIKSQDSQSSEGKDIETVLDQIIYVNLKQGKLEKIISCLSDIYQITKDNPEILYKYQNDIIELYLQYPTIKIIQNYTKMILSQLDYKSLIFNFFEDMDQYDTQQQLKFLAAFSLFQQIFEQYHKIIMKQITNWILIRIDQNHIKSLLVICFNLNLNQRQLTNYFLKQLNKYEDIQLDILLYSVLASQQKIMETELLIQLIQQYEQNARYDISIENISSGNLLRYKSLGELITITKDFELIKQFNKSFNIDVQEITYVQCLILCDQLHFQLGINTLNEQQLLEVIDETKLIQLLEKVLQENQQENNYDVTLQSKLLSFFLLQAFEDIEIIIKQQNLKPQLQERQFIQQFQQSLTQQLQRALNQKQLKDEQLTLKYLAILSNIAEQNDLLQNLDFKSLIQILQKLLAYLKDENISTQLFETILNLFKNLFQWNKAKTYYKITFLKDNIFLDIGLKYPQYKEVIKQILVLLVGQEQYEQQYAQKLESTKPKQIDNQIKEEQNLFSDLANQYIHDILSQTLTRQNQELETQQKEVVSQNQQQQQQQQQKKSSSSSSSSSKSSEDEKKVNQIEAAIVFNEEKAEIKVQFEQKRHSSSSSSKSQGEQIKTNFVIDKKFEEDQFHAQVHQEVKVEQQNSDSSSSSEELNRKQKVVIAAAVHHKIKDNRKDKSSSSSQKSSSKEEQQLEFKLQANENQFKVEIANEETHVQATLQIPKIQEINQIEQENEENEESRQPSLLKQMIVQQEEVSRIQDKQIDTKLKLKQLKEKKQQLEQAKLKKQEEDRIKLEEKNKQEELEKQRLLQLEKIRLEQEEQIRQEQEEQIRQQQLQKIALEQEEKIRQEKEELLKIALFEKLKREEEERQREIDRQEQEERDRQEELIRIQKLEQIRLQQEEIERKKKEEQELYNKQQRELEIIREAEQAREQAQAQIKLDIKVENQADQQSGRITFEINENKFSTQIQVSNNPEQSKNTLSYYYGLPPSNNQEAPQLGQEDLQLKASIMTQQNYRQQQNSEIQISYQGLKLDQQINFEKQELQINYDPGNILFPQNEQKILEIKDDELLLSSQMIKQAALKSERKNEYYQTQTTTIDFISKQEQSSSANQEIPVTNYQINIKEPNYAEQQNQVITQTIHQEILQQQLSFQENIQHQQNEIPQVNQQMSNFEENQDQFKVQIQENPQQNISTNFEQQQINNQEVEKQVLITTSVVTHEINKQVKEVQEVQINKDKKRSSSSSSSSSSSQDKKKDDKHKENKHIGMEVGKTLVEAKIIEQGLKAEQQKQKEQDEKLRKAEQKQKLEAEKKQKEILKAQKLEEEKQKKEAEKLQKQEIERQKKEAEKQKKLEAERLKKEAEQKKKEDERLKKEEEKQKKEAEKLKKEQDKQIKKEVQKEVVKDLIILDAAKNIHQEKKEEEVDSKTKLKMLKEQKKIEEEKTKQEQLKQERVVQIESSLIVAEAQHQHQTKKQRSSSSSSSSQEKSHNIKKQEKHNVQIEVAKNDQDSQVSQNVMKFEITQNSIDDSQKNQSTIEFKVNQQIQRDHQVNQNNQQFEQEVIIHTQQNTNKLEIQQKNQELKTQNIRSSSSSSSSSSGRQVKKSKQIETVIVASQVQKRIHEQDDSNNTNDIQRGNQQIQINQNYGEPLGQGVSKIEHKNQQQEFIQASIKQQSTQQSQEHEFQVQYQQKPQTQDQHKVELLIGSEIVANKIEDQKKVEKNSKKDQNKQFEVSIQQEQNVSRKKEFLVEANLQQQSKKKVQNDKPKSSNSSSSSSSDEEKQNLQKKKEKNVQPIITETIIQEKQKINYSQPQQQLIIQEQDNEQLQNQFQNQQVEISQSMNRQENYVFESASANTVYNQPDNANAEFQPQQEVSTFYQFESQKNNNLQQFEDQQPIITLQTEQIQDSQRTAAFNLEFQESNQQIEVEYVVQEKQGEFQEVNNQMIELNSQQIADVQSFQETQQIQEQLEQRVQQRNKFEDDYSNSQVVQNDESSLSKQPILQNQQPNVGRWQISVLADLLQALQLIVQNEQNQSRLPGVLKQFRQLIQSEKDAKDCHQLDITNQLLFIYSQSSYQAYQIDIEESLLAILQYQSILNDCETLIKWSDLQIARVSINLVRILIKAKETKFMRNRMINQKDIIILVNYLEDCWDEELVSVILTCLEGYCSNSKCAQLLYQYEVINHIKKWIQRLQKECFLLIGSLCLYSFAQKDLNDQAIYLIINKSINDQNIDIKQNAYYALSCLCYQTKEVQQQLLDSDLLFIILIDLEQKSEPKLIEVTAQLLTNILYKLEQQKVESRILISLLIRQLQTQNTPNTLKWILRCLQSLCLLRSNSLISISESIFDILKKLQQNKALLRDLLQLYSTYSAQQLLPSEQVTVIKQIIQNNKDDPVIIEKSVTVLNLSVKQYSKKICTLDNLQIFTQLIEQYKQNEKVISLILTLIQNLACDKDNHSTINKSVMYNALEFFQNNQQINHFSQKIKTIIQNQQIQPEQIQVQMKQIILDNPADKLARGFPLLVFTSTSDTKTGYLKVLPSNELFFQENSGDIKERFRIRQVIDMNFKPNQNSNEYRLYQGSRLFNKDLFFTIRGKYNNKFNTISGQALLIEQKQELVSILEILYAKVS